MTIAEHILEAIRRHGPSTALDIQAILAGPQGFDTLKASAIDHHLIVMAKAGVLRAGRERFYSHSPEHRKRFNEYRLARAA